MRSAAAQLLSGEDGRRVMPLILKGLGSVGFRLQGLGFRTEGSGF